MMKEICKAIRRIASPDDMMKFFDENISYGCVHADGTRYVDSLGGSAFQEMYRTMSLEESLNNRLGICFEQANISKYIYEILGIPCRTFCTRGFTNEHPYPNDLYLVHCYVFGFWGDKVINVEHSDTEKKGIYIYDSIEDAVRETDKIFSEKFRLHGATETRADEYEGYIPGGLTFLEFNQFVKTHSVC